MGARTVKNFFCFEALSVLSNNILTITKNPAQSLSRAKVIRGPFIGNSLWRNAVEMLGKISTMKIGHKHTCTQEQEEKALLCAGDEK